MTFPSFHPSFFTSSSPSFNLSPPFPISIAQLPVIFVLNFSVPLTRVQSARHLMLEYGTELDQLMKSGKLKPKPARTNDSIALWKYLDVNIFFYHRNHCLCLLQTRIWDKNLHVWEQQYIVCNFDRKFGHSALSQVA